MVGTAPDNPPTLLGIFPGPRRFPADSLVESASRLCEICWCDNTLFPGGIATPIVILDESVYQVLKQHSNHDIPHGSLGEQFLVSHLHEAAPQINSQITIGDAILQVIGMVNFQAIEVGYKLPSNASWHLFGLEVSITEEGLIEPGAPVRVTNPQPNRERQP